MAGFYVKFNTGLKLIKINETWKDKLNMDNEIGVIYMCLSKTF